MVAPQPTAASRTLPAIMAGAIAGIVATLATSRVLRPDATGDAARDRGVIFDRPPEVRTEAPDTAADARRLSAIEQRLRAMEARSPSDRSQPDASAEEPLEVPDPEERNQRWSSYVREQEAQPVDGRWASGASRSFLSDLSSLAAARRFDVVSIDCRMTACIGTLEWPSYDAAQAEYSDIVQAHYGMNCASAIRLPTPHDVLAPYQAKVVFSCEEARAHER